MGVFYGDLFKRDWNDFDSVCEVARALASLENPQVVIRRMGRLPKGYSRFCIAFANRPTKSGCKVVARFPEL